MEFDPKDIHIRVIDQRIGAGIGGYDTVIRVYHIPSKIMIEVPSGDSQYKARQVAMEMLELALISDLPNFQ